LFAIQFSRRETDVENHCQVHDFRNAFFRLASPLLPPIFLTTTLTGAI